MCAPVRGGTEENVPLGCAKKKRTIRAKFASSHVVAEAIQFVGLAVRFGCKPLRPCLCATSSLFPLCDDFKGCGNLLAAFGFNYDKGGNLVGESSIRVLVVDDYEPWRQFACTTLLKQPDLEIIGEVSDGLEAVQQAKELQPDLILLDIGLPTLNGIEAARRIREVSSASKILFVSENRSADMVEAALSNGAGGYVVKSDAAGELLPAIKAVLEGKRFISASLAGHFLVATTLSTTQTMLSSMVMLISGIR